MLNNIRDNLSIKPKSPAGYAVLHGVEGGIVGGVCNVPRVVFEYHTPNNPILALTNVPVLPFLLGGFGAAYGLGKGQYKQHGEPESLGKTMLKAEVNSIGITAGAYGVYTIVEAMIQHFSLSPDMFGEFAFLSVFWGTLGASAYTLGRTGFGVNKNPQQPHRF